MHYDANWLLIVDNLSDFAHLAFVHTKTLGGSEEYAYVTKPVAVERLPRGFRVERWHMDATPPPFHRKVLPAAEKDQPSTAATSATCTSPASSSWSRCSRRPAAARRTATAKAAASTATASS
jgi:phenylpropionate dioxygenase-like ring-hydroxylating dioxygenase large terminal subunit